jgi:hypothetical protein
MTEEVRRAFSIQRMISGLLLIGLGLAFFFDQLDFLDVRGLWQYWPVALIIIGVLRLVQPDRPEQRYSGLWWLLIGVWALVSSFELFGLDWSNSWPLLIVAAGISIVFRAVVPPPVAPQNGGQDGVR